MKRRWWQPDLGLLCSTAAILAFGWMVLYSATRWSGATSEPSRQLFYIAVGAVLMAGAATLDYRWTGRLAAPLYLAGLGLLVLVMIPGVGQSANGAQRWLALGPMGAFQPSELAKLVLIVALARLLSVRGEDEDASRLSPGRFLAALVTTAVPFCLIALQPDLGTALVLAVICLVMLYCSGASPIILAGLVTGGLGVLPYVLKEYQRDRILVFLSPEADPMGMGYSLIQSKTAIGSGGLWGSGFLQGHMTQNGFVPENWTDFIFSALGEEWGLLGGAGLLLLFGLLFLSILRAARRAPDLQGTLLAMGVLTLLSFQLFVNLSMTVGLAPVVGLPLPLASYGGSAMMLSMAAIGLVANVSLQAHRRPKRETPMELELDGGRYS